MVHADHVTRNRPFSATADPTLGSGVVQTIESDLIRLRTREGMKVAKRRVGWYPLAGRLADLDRVGDVLHDKVGKSIRPPISLWISESR